VVDDGRGMTEDEIGASRPTEAPLSFVLRPPFPLVLLLVALGVLLLSPFPDDRVAVGAVRAGDAARRAYDYPAAVSAYQQAVVRQVWNPAPWLRLARVHVVMQENVAALQEAYAAGSRGGFTPEVRAELGQAFAHLGDTAAALEQWRQVANELPEAPGPPRVGWDALERVAAGFYDLGVGEEAEALYRRLLMARPDPRVAYRLGLLLAARQPEEAGAYLRQAAHDPRFQAQADIVLSVLLQERSDPAEAAAHLGAAFARVEEWRLAEQQLSRAVAQRPNSARALAYLGLARDQLGQDGYAPLAQALALAPEDPLVHTLMGYHWKRLGWWEAARVEFEQAYDRDPANAALSAEIGLMYAARGDYETARIWLREATRLAPEDPAFWKLAARFYLDRAFEVAREGLPAALRATELAPDDAEAYDLLGWALYLNGDVAGALGALKRALALDPGLAGAHYHMGLVQARRGDREAARQAFARAAALDPGGPVGRLAQRELSP